MTAEMISIDAKTTDFITTKDFIKKTPEKTRYFNVEILVLKKTLTNQYF